MNETNKKIKEESDLVYEIMGGKKTTKKTGVAEGSGSTGSPSPAPAEEKKKPKTKSDDDILIDEILYGKEVKTGKVRKLSKEEKEDLDETTEILYGRDSDKKNKKPETEVSDDSSASELTGKKPKKVNRDDYFGL
jgi:hypothetical protein